MEMAMELRLAVEADLPEVVELTNLAFRGDIGWTLETKYIEGQRTDQETLNAEMAANPDALLMIWRDDADRTLLGSVWLEPGDKETWYMGLLAVRPEQQGRQLGRQMVEASEELARSRGGKKMRISVVNVREKLMRWYERRGYLRTGEQKPFPYGDERVGRPLRNDLHFVVMEKMI
jgi:ribosomal protein S18 acetylase RimI-like enzyme